MDIKHLPPNFLIDITKIPGSSDSVCLIAIEHYKQFLDHPDPIIKQLAQAMVGNLTEYYGISHIGSPNLDAALPHLSDMSNFMDSKNSPNMDIQSTARIKSFYSAYEKLLLECSERLERNEPLPTSSISTDLIATRDILYPRYHFKFQPQKFYHLVYRTILEYMEFIDNLSESDPRYGFVEVEKSKKINMTHPQKTDFEPDESFSVPDRDFKDFALEIKGVPNIYRYLTPLTTNMSELEIRQDIETMQNPDCSQEDLFRLPLTKALISDLQKQRLLAFRNQLEQDFIDNVIPKNPKSKMWQEYRQIPTQNFLYIYKHSIKPEYRDYLPIIDAIDQAITSGTYRVDWDTLITSSEASQKAIAALLHEESITQSAILSDRLELLRSMDLDNFDRNMGIAKKIEYYAACSKDYMRFPKGTGYQSFHVLVRAPFGIYEKQFRTEDQDRIAEHGHASHSKIYKPDEKEYFHRLKICTPLMPMRDENSEIISPLQLEPLSFDEAIIAYYHKPFEVFSGGLSLKAFRAQYPDEDDFDEAILALSQPNEKFANKISNAFNFLKNLRKRSSSKNGITYTGPERRNFDEEHDPETR